MVLVDNDLCQSVRTRLIAEKARSSSAFEMDITRTIAINMENVLKSSIFLRVVL